VQTIRAGEQPVQADDLDARSSGLRPQLGASLARDVRDQRREGKRRDLYAVVAALLQEPADTVEGPVFVQLVAHGEAH